MLSTQLTALIAQQHIAELHQAAADRRLAHATRDARRPDTGATRMFARRLRRRQTSTQPASR